MTVEEYFKFIKEDSEIVAYAEQLAKENGIKEIFGIPPSEAVIQMLTQEMLWEEFTEQIISRSDIKDYFKSYMKKRIEKGW